MASLRQLQNKIKTFKDFEKVVNIQKIVIMKKILESKKYVEQVNFRQKLFLNQLLDINKKFYIFDSSIFNSKKANIPIKRNLYFILPRHADDKLGNYVDKLLLEFIQKNHSPHDLYVVMDLELEKLFLINDIKILKVMKNVSVDDYDLYNRIAFQIIRAHSDMLFYEAFFLFFNVLERKIVSEKLFPLPTKKYEFSENEKNGFTDDMKLLFGTNINDVSFYKDVEKVGNNILNQTINMQVYSRMINYKIAIYTRELQSLDDKEKNIKAEIELIRLKMQKVRKDSITNELLTNAVAFGTINKIGEGDE